MEPGLIAMMVCMGLGSIIAIAAIGTHIFDWRFTVLQRRRKQEKDDLEKAQETEKASLSGTGYHTSSVSAPNSEKAEVRREAVHGGYTSLQSPPLTSKSTSGPTVSACFDDILIITSPKSATTESSATLSPTSECTVSSPITPCTPFTPITPVPTVFSTGPKLATSATRPLLLSQGSLNPLRSVAGSSHSHYTSDPYTYLAPRVMGSKLRRYATPPRQLRVTIPARNAGTYCERSHRRLPSDNVITAPPRVLARSISELVGGDDTDEVAARLVGRLPLRTVADERLCADNVDEVGRLGW